MPARLRAARRKVQMFQDPNGSLTPRLTVGRAIAEPLLVHEIATSRGETRDRVAALLDRVGLKPDMADRCPREFSGGQRQRVSIARALAMSPALLIADEAVSALDVSVKSQIVDLLRTLQAELGISLLFISHDMAVVEQISHPVAVIRQGQIVEIGSRDEVIGQPQHTYTRKLLASVPVPDPTHLRSLTVLSSEEIPSPMRRLDAPDRALPRGRQYSPDSIGGLMMSATDLHEGTQFYIDGRWQPASGDARHPLIDAVTEAPWGQIAIAGLRSCC